MGTNPAGGSHAGSRQEHAGLFESSKGLHSEGHHPDACKVNGGYLTADAGNAGWFTRTDVPGTLGVLVKEQGKYPFLLNDKSQWSVRKDVYYYDAREKTGSPLSSSSNNGSSIGPELSFGFVMGQMLDEPVLVIKSCIGNRGLGWDLLPPGSKRFMEVGLSLGRAMQDLLKK